MPTTICRVCGALSTAAVCPSCGAPTQVARLERTAAAAAESAGMPSRASDVQAPAAEALASWRRRGPAVARNRAERGQLDVGRAVADAVRLSVRWFAPYVLVTGVLSTVPGWLIGQYIAPDGPPQPNLRVLAFLPLTLLLGNVAAAAVTYGVVQQLRGAPAPLGTWLVHALRCLPSVVGVFLLVLLLAGLPIALGGAALIFSPRAAVLLIPAGLVAGIAVYVALSLAVPVAVAERPGVLAALARSRTLTAGSRWRILGVFTMLWVANLLLLVPISLAKQPWLELAAQIVVAPLAAVVPAVIYHALRIAKEGADAESIAAVFD